MEEIASAEILEDGGAAAELCGDAWKAGGQKNKGKTAIPQILDFLQEGLKKGLS